MRPLLAALETRPTAQDNAEVGDSIMSADVMVPDDSAEGGWAIVGRLEDLPAAPAWDGDAGVNVRRPGLPKYFVPQKYRIGDTYHRTASWLGFQTTAVRQPLLNHRFVGHLAVPLPCSPCLHTYCRPKYARGPNPPPPQVRFANMHNHWTPDHPRAFGLCHVSFFEEDLSTSMQLVGAAAVRGRMLQLVPGETFVAAAARSVMYLPPTLGDAAFDGSAARMREWMDLATRVAMGGDLRTLRELEQSGVRLSDYVREESGAARLHQGGGAAVVDVPRVRTEQQQCAAASASSHDSSDIVLMQHAWDAVGDFTLTASQHGAGSGASLGHAPPLMGHGTLPREPFDHIGRGPSTLPGENLGPRTPQVGSSASSQGDEEECTEEEQEDRQRQRPVTMRLTAAGWVADSSASHFNIPGEPRRRRCTPRTTSEPASGQQAASVVSSARQLGEMGDAQPANPLLFGAAYVPFASEMPLTYFKAEADLFVGSAAPLNARTEKRKTARATDAQRSHPSSVPNDGQGGLWICYSDLEPSELAVAIPTTDGVGQPSYSGSGVVRPAIASPPPLLPAPLLTPYASSRSPAQSHLTLSLPGSDTLAVPSLAVRVAASRVRRLWRTRRLHSPRRQGRRTDRPDHAANA